MQFGTIQINMLKDIRNEIELLKDLEKAVFLTRFFKTGKGEYGEGDIFYGLAVPVSRKIALKYKNLPLNDVKALLLSIVHEERLIAVFILVLQFQKADEEQQKAIYEFYLANTKYINNWDIVDSSADKIVGEYLWKRVEFEDAKNVLKTLAQSQNLWERRIAIIATFAFIKHGNAELTCCLAEILLQDKEDLIHKAVGWMLREVGKRVSKESEQEFLSSMYKSMPRTMLRYAIEHFTEEERKHYLLGII